MSGFDTISAITENLLSLLKSLGLNFVTEIDDLAALPASVLPHGQLFYEQANFEYAHNQKPEYATAGFKAIVVLALADAHSAIRLQQSWTHLIRDALTVNALNVGALAASKLVSLASVDGVECGTTNDKAFISFQISIRYRDG